LTGGLAIAPFVTDGPEEVDVAEVVDGGMFAWKWADVVAAFDVYSLRCDVLS
jgi:hypothetical protein